MLRYEHAGRHTADMVARASDPLDARGDRGRSLDLDHLIDRAHVDPELERRGRDDRGEVAGLEPLLGRASDVLRHRPVMRERDLFAGGLVQGRCEALREAPAVDEDHRRARGADALDEAGMHPGPDALRVAAAVVERVEVDVRCARITEGNDGEGRRDLHRDRERLLRRCVDDLDGPRKHPLSLHLGAAEQARDLVERPLRRGQPDALDAGSSGRFGRFGRFGRVCGERSVCFLAQGLEPLEREEEVRAALARGHLVDLVDDDRVDRREDLALARGQQQVERLRRRDEDVRRRAEHLRPIEGGCVPGADGDLEAAEVRAEATAHRRDAGDGSTKVALDVDRERLQRRDVEDAKALLRVGDR